MEQLVPQMLNDLLKIVLDPVMPPDVVPEPDRPNDFQLVYQDATASHHESTINLRRPFSRELLYPNQLSARRSSLQVSRSA